MFEPFPGDYEDLDISNDTDYFNFTGRWRSYRGVDVPTECPPGSYCPEGTLHSMEFLCPNGTYSNQTGLDDDSQCTPCDPGWYCSGEGKVDREWQIAF